MSSPLHDQKHRAITSGFSLVEIFSTHIPCSVKIGARASVLHVLSAKSLAQFGLVINDSYVKHPKAFRYDLVAQPVDYIQYCCVACIRLWILIPPRLTPFHIRNL